MIASGLNEFFVIVGKNLVSNFNTSVNASDMLIYFCEPSSFTFFVEPGNEAVKPVIQTILTFLKKICPGCFEMPTAVSKEYF